MKNKGNKKDKPVFAAHQTHASDRIQIKLEPMRRPARVEGDHEEQEGVNWREVRINPLKNMATPSKCLSAHDFQLLKYTDCLQRNRLFVLTSPSRLHVFPSFSELARRERSDCKYA
jgi:hypothetical protein